MVRSEEKIKDGQKPLRVLPGVIIVIIQWFLWLILPLIAGTDVMMATVGGSALCAVAVALWWLFWSKAPGIDRIGALLFAVVAMLLTAHFIDVSIATANMGLMLAIYSLPVMSLALVISAVIAKNMPDRKRRAIMATVIIIASGMWLFLKTDGLTGDFRQELNWRWAKTAEQKFLETERESMEAAAQDRGAGEWPGFRGKDRDGIARGIKIGTDWKLSPPVLVWKKQLGPGASSFAVSGGLLYTQEQRGEEEAVTCYDQSNGKPVWIYKYKARFWDSHTGAGPRGTPTLYKGRLYTFGGTGILNVLDAKKGTLVWSRDAAVDANIKALTWGFSSSPLVYGNMVYVAVAGKMAAYDLATGAPKWFGPEGGKCYSSPQLVTLSGVAQIVLINEPGVFSFNPADGKVLWTYACKAEDRVIQPMLTGDGGILLGVTMQGTRRIDVSMDKDKKWNVKEGWNITAAKPNFNDYVIHKGHAYGYNGFSLVCLDVKDGSRKWKGGNSGGQMILLEEQGLLLISAENGDLELVSATPEKFTELARVSGIKGRTWNHPALSGGIFLVRNSEEMAAFRLPPK